MVINEVQLSPTAERFIELYNTGDTAIDLSTYLMQRKTATQTTFSSLVTSAKFLGKIINPHSYFVISRQQLSASDVVLDTLTLTEDNTIQIKISGASEVVSKVGWGNVTDCGGVCAPNPADGQSIYLASGVWTSGVPTLGLANVSTLAEIISPPIVSSSQSTPPTAPSSGSGGEDLSKSVSKVQNIKTQISAPSFAFVDTPFSLSASSTGHYGEALMYGKYFWNFGDGDSKEMKVNEVENFSHTYFYAGEYTINLEYYMNYYSTKPETSIKFILKVVEPSIVISNVGDKDDFFIEFTNNTVYDADISNWILEDGVKSFILPKNSILLSKKKMILSPRITHLAFENKDYLRLLNSDRVMIYEYIPIIIAPIVSVVAKIQTPVVVVDKIKNTQIVETKVDAFESLSASPVLAPETDVRTYIPITSFVLFLGATSGAVYFIRRKKNPFTSGDDFELLDE